MTANFGSVAPSRRVYRKLKFQGSTAIIEKMTAWLAGEPPSPSGGGCGAAWGAQPLHQAGAARGAGRGPFRRAHGACLHGELPEGDRRDRVCEPVDEAERDDRPLLPPPLGVQGCVVFIDVAAEERRLLAVGRQQCGLQTAPPPPLASHEHRRPKPEAEHPHRQAGGRDRAAVKRGGQRRVAGGGPAGNGDGGAESGKGEGGEGGEGRRDRFQGVRRHLIWTGQPPAPPTQCQRCGEYP